MLILSLLQHRHRCGSVADMSASAVWLNGFWFFSHNLGAFRFGSSLMVALVIMSKDHFFFKFHNFHVQIYSFGLGFSFGV